MFIWWRAGEKRAEQTSLAARRLRQPDGGVLSSWSERLFRSSSQHRRYSARARGLSNIGV